MSHTDDPLQSLVYVLENHPNQMEVVDAGDLLMESARQNPKRPAYVKLAVPDKVVKSLRGKRGQGDRVLMVVLPKETLERKDSRIILPGDVR